MFLKDQVIDDGGKGNSSSSFVEIPVYVDHISSPVKNIDQGEDFQGNGGDVVTMKLLQLMLWSQLKK